MADVTFLNWAFKVMAMIERSHALNKTADVMIAELEAELESGFKAIYDEAVKADDNYVHVDDAYDYVMDNYEPPERDY